MRIFSSLASIFSKISPRRTGAPTTWHGVHPRKTVIIAYHTPVHGRHRGVDNAIFKDKKNEIRRKAMGRFAGVFGSPAKKRSNKYAR